MGEVYSKTLDRTRNLRDLGYNVTEMWECEYAHLRKADPDCREFFDEVEILDPLDPRDGFFGGRTSAARLYYKAKEDEVIRYYDYVSLYPTINKYGKLPVGHPEIYTDQRTYTVGQFYGFVKCKVLPPTNLYHPVLPYRSNGRLLFPLCKLCVDERLQEPCEHTDEERCIIGTWCSPELDKAIAKGYRVLKVYEVWHFRETAEYGKPGRFSEGIFGSYVNTLLKIKQEASGWPEWIKTDDDKDRFIEEYCQKEGK